jgi:hypothetical protein
MTCVGTLNAFAYSCCTMGATMTNHQSRLSTAGEFYRILADSSLDEVGEEQGHHIEAGQKADAAKLDFPYRTMSERSFARLRFGLADSEGERAIANTMRQTEESAGQKIFLPSRTNEPRFAPQQYYYPASKSGVMPSWAIPAAVHRG